MSCMKPNAVFARIVDRVVAPNKGRKKGVSYWDKNGNFTHIASLALSKLELEKFLS